MLTAAAGGVNEMRAGTYVYGDRQQWLMGAIPADGCALVVASTVVSVHADRIVLDAGAKALTLNVPHAGVIGEPDMDYNAGSDEFGWLTFKEARKAWKMGDRMELVVPHCDPVVNLYDFIYGIRNDRVESVWPITARGHSQ